MSALRWLPGNVVDYQKRAVKIALEDVMCQTNGVDLMILAQEAQGHFEQAIAQMEKGGDFDLKAIKKEFKQSLSQSVEDASKARKEVWKRLL